MNTTDVNDVNFDWRLVRNEAAGLLKENNFPGAIELLEHTSGEDPTGECQALLGMVHFKCEDYAAAAGCFAAALKQEAGNVGWRDLLAQAQANLLAEIPVHVPDLKYFKREDLLAPPVNVPGMLPEPPPARLPTPAEKFEQMVGHALGASARLFMTAMTNLAGGLGGYRDEVWTNWYRKPLSAGILTLAHMRKRLDRHNLENTYATGILTGFQPAGQTPPQGVTHFRTADGSWNNLDNPKEGAAGTRFLRNIPVSAIRPETGAQLMSPNPREISRKLLTRHGPMQEISFLNLLAAAWIQFQTHGWINHGEILFHDVHEIPLAPDDPARKKYHQTKMFVGKTQPDPTRTPADTAPLTFINEVTHWWDGSQIYGSDLKTQHRLRSFVGGKMRVTANGCLPLDKKGIEETGFQRNWWAGLALLHTLFVREHNAICDHLKTFHPQWDDNRLFNVARLINAAVMAKIHTVEWTPAVLPNPVLNTAMNSNWFGYLTSLHKPGRERKVFGGIKWSDPEFGGVVGNTINKHGQPYGLSEEFVEVYRLHSLIPETIRVRQIERDGMIGERPLTAVRQAGSAKIIGQFGVSNLLYSFGNQHPGQLVLNNFPAFMQELSIPGNPMFDLGAVDILRARERGVPRYNEFRRLIDLNPIRSFDDLTNDQEQVRKLKDVYGGEPTDVENLDLMIGTLAEGHRPTAFGFGETLFQIFILNASRRLQADRFYTDSYNEETYTREGLDWVDNATFKTVLLRHCPELAKTGLANVTNAFEPWDTDRRLDPARHPLRAFEPDLKKDPWLGDAFRSA